MNLAGNQIGGGINRHGEGIYTAEGITAISDALRVNGVLTTVWTSAYNPMPCIYLSCPWTNTQVCIPVQLNLAGNRLCGVWDNYDGRGLQGTYTTEGIKVLADALLVNGVLTSLE